MEKKLKLVLVCEAITSITVGVVSYATWYPDATFISYFPAGSLYGLLGFFVSAMLVTGIAWGLKKGWRRVNLAIPIISSIFVVLMHLSFAGFWSFELFLAEWVSGGMGLVVCYGEYRKTARLKKEEKQKGAREKSQVHDEKVKAQELEREERVLNQFISDGNEALQKNDLIRAHSDYLTAQKQARVLGKDDLANQLEEKVKEIQKVITENETKENVERQSKEIEERQAILRRILEMYDSISLEKMAKLLNLPNEIELERWLLSVPENFPLKIDGGIVKITSPDISKDIDRLLASFKDWETGKIGKI